MSPLPFDAAAWGIDLALTPAGDLAISPSGDVALASGAANLVQALRLRLFCAYGELPLHPDYGSRLNSEYIGPKNIPAFAVSAEIQTEMEELIVQDSRFIDAEVIDTGEPTGSTTASTIKITAVDGTELTVSALPEPQLVDVSVPLDQAQFDLAQEDFDTPVAVDEIAASSFFADESEADTLADADLLATLAADQASQNSILP